MIYIVGVVLIIFALIIDILEVLTDIASTTVVLVILKIIDTGMEIGYNIFLGMFLITLSLVMKKNWFIERKNAASLASYIVGTLAELVPELDILPIRTLTLIILLSFIIIELKKQKATEETNEEEQIIKEVEPVYS